jgi:hypothetical protein
MSAAIADDRARAEEFRLYQVSQQPQTGTQTEAQQPPPTINPIVREARMRAGIAEVQQLPPQSRISPLIQARMKAFEVPRALRTSEGSTQTGSIKRTRGGSSSSSDSGFSSGPDIDFT